MRGATTKSTAAVRASRGSGYGNNEAVQPQAPPCGSVSGSSSGQQQQAYQPPTLLMLVQALVLGLDAVIKLASGPTHYDRMDNVSFVCSNNVSTAFVRPGDEWFSTSQSLWAAGQMAGSLVAMGLPSWVGFRATIVCFNVLSIGGNLMYALADPSIGGFGQQGLALAGSFVVGLGAAQVGVAMGFIALEEQGEQRVESALVLHKILLMLGMVVGTVLTLPLQGLLTQDRFWGALAIQPGVGAALVAVFAYAPLLVASFFLLRDNRPPTKQGRAMSCYCDGKVLFWLLVAVLFGWIVIGAAFFLPVFKYTVAGGCEALASFISYASIGAFAFAFFGAAFPKIFSCIPGISEIVALSYIRSATAACLVGLGFCFAAYSVLSTTLDSLPDAFIIVGLAFIFYAGGSLAANFSVVYQRTIPRTSLSTLMPVYSICQDIGQIVAPRIDVELLKSGPNITWSVQIVIVGVFFVLMLTPYGPDLSSITTFDEDGKRPDGLFCCSSRFCRRAERRSGELVMGPTFRGLVANNGAVVFKDVPRLVLRTRVFQGQVPKSPWALSPPRNVVSDSQVVFDGARIAATLNACNEGDDVINSESRRNILVAHLVCTLKRCFGEAPSRGHDAESSSQISSTIEASSRSGVIFDCDETFTELNQNYDLAGEFPGKGAVDQDAREATNGSHKPTQSAPNTWAVLQAINQSCVFPAIAQIHERLAESSITRSPVLDERTDDAWTVDIFIGGAMDSSVLVRHRRRMRSSDPEWPFRALWQLDISFSACGGDHPQPRPMKPSTSTASTGAGSNVIVGPGMHLHLNHNDESTADYDADACANVSDVAESSGVHVQPIECVGGRLAVVECSFEFSPNEGQASRKLARFKRCFGPPQKLEKPGVVLNHATGWGAPSPQQKQSGR
eukprot:INCI2658.1.p1 GENE.INCI2658.1~~INCI2658.1.p1  ORF type:complete len:954 (+),score=123.46 INCI2658.1:161-2863(+)